MSKLKTYTEFINERFIDAIKNPIKWKKIKNNAKEFQKAKVDQALNNIDYAKRLEKGKAQDLSKDKKEILKAANKAKEDALKFSASAVGMRMDDLATTDGLKIVVRLAKTKATLAANAIALKAADGEQKKLLKIKAKAITSKLGKLNQALKDYESTADADQEETKVDDNSPAARDARDKQETDDGKAETANKEKIEGLEVKVDDARTKAKNLPETATAKDKAKAKLVMLNVQKTLAKLKGDDQEVIDGFAEEIEAQTAIATSSEEGGDGEEGGEELSTNTSNKDKPPTEEEREAKNSKEGKIKRYEDLIAQTENPGKKRKFQRKIEDLQKESLERFMDPMFVSLVEAELTKFEAGLYEPLVESVSDKFDRLRQYL